VDQKKKGGAGGKGAPMLTRGRSAERGVKRSVARNFNEKDALRGNGCCFAKKEQVCGGAKINNLVPALEKVSWKAASIKTEI